MGVIFEELIYGSDFMRYKLVVIVAQPSLVHKVVANSLSQEDGLSGVIYSINLSVLKTVLYSVNPLSEAKPWIYSALDGSEHLLISIRLALIVNSGNGNEQGTKCIFLRDKLLVGDANF